MRIKVVKMQRKRRGGGEEKGVHAGGMVGWFFIRVLSSEFLLGAVRRPVSVRGIFGLVRSKIVTTFSSSKTLIIPKLCSYIQVYIYIYRVHRYRVMQLVALMTLVCLHAGDWWKSHSCVMRFRVFCILLHD